MASHPGAPFSAVRCSTVPAFKPSWALNIGLPSNPSATPTTNVTPTKKLMRFMEAPFISQRILTRKIDASSIVLSRMTVHLVDDRQTGRYSGPEVDLSEVSWIRVAERTAAPIMGGAEMNISARASSLISVLTQPNAGSVCELATRPAVSPSTVGELRGPNGWDRA